VGPNYQTKMASEASKRIRTASTRLASGDNVADIKLQAHRDARKKW